MNARIICHRHLSPAGIHGWQMGTDGGQMKNASATQKNTPRSGVYSLWWQMGADNPSYASSFDYYLVDQVVWVTARRGASTKKPAPICPRHRFSGGAA